MVERTLVNPLGMLINDHENHWLSLCCAPGSAGARGADDLFYIYPLRRFHDVVRSKKRGLASAEPCCATCCFTAEG